jgi:hypothetical protein
MPIVPIVLVLLHAGAALFWLFASFLLARNKGRGSAQWFRWQMVAALLVFGTGGYLWHLLHEGLFGPPEIILASGMVCAVIAAGVQGMLVGASIRKLKRGAMTDAAAYARIHLGQRISSGILALALITMVAASHAVGWHG